MRMTQAHFYAHFDPDPRLRSPNKRARRQGILNPKIGENIYQLCSLVVNKGEHYKMPGEGNWSHTPDGPALPMHTYLSFSDAIVDGWMDSPLHRKTLLNPEAVELGVGAYFLWRDNWPGFMAVQNFQLFDSVRTR